MTTITTEDQTTAAFARLRRAREQHDALAPLRRILTDLDEETRAAAAAAVAAGLSERPVAAQLGVSQPTVHTWLDGRTTAPQPQPQLAERAWTLHHLVSAAASLAQRMEGEHVPDRAPTEAHMVPRIALREARSKLAGAAHALGALGAALEYDGRAR